MPTHRDSAGRVVGVKRAIKHGAALTIGLALAGALAGTGIGLSRTDTSVAEATIMINPLDGNPFSTSGRGDDPINLITEAELIRSDAVVRRVQESLDDSTPPARVLSQLSISVPANSQILEITYKAQVEETARDRAQAFAEEYLAFRQDRAEALLAAQVSRIDEQIGDARDEQARLARRLSAPTTDVGQTSVLRAQLDAVSSQLNQLNTRALEIKSVPLDPGQIVQPSATVRPGVLDFWATYSVAGMLAGLAIGLVISLFRARLDSRVHHVDDVVTAGLPLIGTVSYATCEAIDSEFEKSPDSASISDEFRELRVSILTADHRRPLVIVLATASAHGRPVTARPLLLAMALARLDAVVVDTLAGAPATGKPAKLTLADVLAANGDPSPAIVRLRSNASMIYNRDDANDNDLVVSPQMREMVDRLRDSFDITIIVTGGLGDPRTRALADDADAVVVEVAEGDSKYEDLTRASEASAPVSEKLMGAIYIEGRPAAKASRRKQAKGDS